MILRSVVPVPVPVVIIYLLYHCNNRINLLTEAYTNGSVRQAFRTGTQLQTSPWRRIPEQPPSSPSPPQSWLRMNEPKAGSFFIPIPEQDPIPTNSSSSSSSSNGNNIPVGQVDAMPPPKLSKAIQPSTINGIPSEQVGFDLGMTLQTARQKDPITRKPFVGIGPSSLNDVTKPEYDDQGYTLYVDETTGTKARVFEALVNYPCLFTLKIVGANDDTFVQDVLQIVAETCQVADTDENESTSTSTSTTATAITTVDVNNGTLEHSIKYNGKWASITVQAPVQSAQMLYQLYENVDRDPRVKFKF